jgi:hypothetical protein
MGTNSIMSVMLFLAVLLCSFTTGVCSAKPKLVFDKDIIDLGEVQDGNTPVVEFRFSNKGREPLVIDEAVGGCKCDILKVTKSTLLPGDSAYVVAQARSEYGVGPVVDKILVKSNDPVNPLYLLQIRRFVVKRTLAIPERLYIDLGENSSPIRTVRVLGPNGDNAFKVLHWKTDLRQIILGKPHYAGQTKEGRPLWELTVEAKRNQGYNVNEGGDIEIVTNDKQKSLIKIAVTFLEDVPIKIHPRTLTFVLDDREPIRSKNLAVVWYGEPGKKAAQLTTGPAIHCKAEISSQKSEAKSIQWSVQVTPLTTGRAERRIQRDEIILLFPEMNIELGVPVTIIDLREAKGPQDSANQKTSTNP